MSQSGGEDFQEFVKLYTIRHEDHDSIGKIKSGNFKNIKTRNKYIFYLTGNGQRVYFEVGDKRYLVDTDLLSKIR